MRKIIFALWALALWSAPALGQDTSQTARRVVVGVTNSASTGTTLNRLAKLSGSPSKAVMAGASDTDGVIGVVTGGAGTTGVATVQTAGLAPCAFDGATTAGGYVQASTTTAGKCHDAGSSYPASGQVIGRVLSTNGSAGTYPVLLTPGVKAGGGMAGGGSIGVVAIAEVYQNQSLSGLPVIDGYNVVSGDRVLLLSQMDETENGVWVASAGAWSRPADFANGSLHPSGALVYVRGTGAGQNQLSAAWISLHNAVDDQATFIVGTDPLNWPSRQLVIVGGQEATQGPVLDMGTWGRTDSTSVLGKGYALALAPIDLGGMRLVNAVDPVNDQDVVTKNFAKNAANITAGTLAVARGGTGQTSYTNGQLLIGNSTGNTLTKATLTQGANVTITNGGGSITIAAIVGGVGGWTDSTTRTVAASVTQYNYVFPSSTAFNSVESNRQSIVPDAFTLSRMYIRTSTPQPADGALTCTVRVNGTTDTSLSITVAANAAAGVFSDTTHTASVNAGDLLSLKCVNASTSSSAGIFDFRFVMVKN